MTSIHARRKRGAHRFEESDSKKTSNREDGVQSYFI